MQDKIILIEDHDYKRTKIIDFLVSHYKNVDILQAKSYTSGKDILGEEGVKLLLLDVSLPTYDKTAEESGGRFRALGGRELARRAIRLNPNLPIVFITQFKSFKEKDSSYSFDDLTDVLKKDCGECFRGVIFFDGAISSWKESLEEVLKGIRFVCEY